MANSRTSSDARADHVSRDPYRITDRDVYLLLALEVAVMLLWAFWRLLGVELEIRGARGTREVALTTVVLTTTLAAVASYALLRVLRRRGLRAWTATAVTVLLVSCAGPFLASSLAAGVAFLSFHLLVGLGLIGGVRHLHGAGR